VEALAVVVGVWDLSLPMSSQSVVKSSFPLRRTSDKDGFLLAFDGRMSTTGGDAELEDEGDAVVGDGNSFLALNHLLTPSLLVGSLRLADPAICGGEFGFRVK